MNEKDVIDFAAKVSSDVALGVWKEVYGDLFKPSAQEVGKAVGYWIARWRLHNQGSFEEELLLMKHHLANLDKRLAEIPSDRLVFVRPEIAVPIIERLSYYTDQTLSELFINLLATAADNDTTHLAHPGFIRVIEHLSPDEARLLLLFGESNYVTYIRLEELKKEFPEVSVPGSFYFGAKSGLTLDFPDNIEAYEANLEGLGLLAPFIPEEPLEVFDKMQGLVHELGLDIAHTQFPFCWQYMNITSYGRMFLDACTKDMT